MNKLVIYTCLLAVLVAMIQADRDDFDGRRRGSKKAFKRRMKELKRWKRIQKRLRKSGRFGRGNMFAGLTDSAFGAAGGIGGFGLGSGVGLGIGPAHGVARGPFNGFGVRPASRIGLASVGINSFTHNTYNIEGVPVSTNIPIRHHHKLVKHIDETGLHNDLISKELHAPYHSPLGVIAPPPLVNTGATVVAPDQIHDFVPHHDHTGPHVDVVSRANLQRDLNSPHVLPGVPRPIVGLRGLTKYA